MSCLSVAIKVVICAALSLIVVKLAIDQQRVDWHSKKLIHTEKCSDIVLGPEMRLDWPNWRIFADQLAQETQAADEKEESFPNGPYKGKLSIHANCFRLLNQNSLQAGAADRITAVGCKFEMSMSNTLQRISLSSSIQSDLHFLVSPSLP